MDIRYSFKILGILVLSVIIKNNISLMKTIKVNYINVYITLIISKCIFVY